MQSECSHSSYSSNAFLLGLCGSRGVLLLHPLDSGIFTMVTCLRIVGFLVRGMMLGTTYIAILIHDFLIFSSNR